MDAETLHMPNVPQIGTPTSITRITKNTKHTHARPRLNHKHGHKQTITFITFGKIQKSHIAFQENHHRFKLSKRNSTRYPHIMQLSQHNNRKIYHYHLDRSPNVISHSGSRLGIIFATRLLAT